MQVDQGPDSVVNAFNIHPVYDKILSYLSPASLIRLGRASNLTLNAVQDFSYRAFDINRSLSRFISDPIAFRTLQARTGTVISGSFALQFFDRTFYPESDLDIYTRHQNAFEIGEFLMKDGYTFQPNLAQDDDFEVAAIHSLSMSVVVEDLPQLGADFQLEPLDEEHLEHYRLHTIREVYTFLKASAEGSDDGPPLKAQIIIPKTTPFECILGYHSTCVMNIITYNAAYSLYPYATFERREALAINVNDSQGAALRKYSSRGWKIIAPGSPLIISSTQGQATLAGHFYLGESRWVVDSKSWLIPLNIEGVRGPPPPSPSSTPITWDPVAECSWKLQTLRVADQAEFHMSYSKTSTSVLAHRYTVADGEYLDMLIAFFKTQGKLEYSKLPKNQRERGEFWTWWDSELPLFRENYWRMLRNRENAAVE